MRELFSLPRGNMSKCLFTPGRTSMTDAPPPPKKGSIQVQVQLSKSVSVNSVKFSEFIGTTYTQEYGCLRGICLTKEPSLGWVRIKKATTFLELPLAFVESPSFQSSVSLLPTGQLLPLLMLSRGLVHL